MRLHKRALSLVTILSLSVFIGVIEPPKVVLASNSSCNPEIASATGISNVWGKEKRFTLSGPGTVVDGRQQLIQNSKSWTAASGLETTGTETASSTAGGTLPGYDNIVTGGTLPGYDNIVTGGTLPGYDTIKPTGTRPSPTKTLGSNIKTVTKDKPTNILDDNATILDTIKPAPNGYVVDLGTNDSSVRYAEYDKNGVIVGYFDDQGNPAINRTVVHPAGSGAGSQGDTEIIKTLSNIFVTVPDKKIPIKIEPTSKDQAKDKTIYAADSDSKYLKLMAENPALKKSIQEVRTAANEYQRLTKEIEQQKAKQTFKEEYLLALTNREKTQRSLAAGLFYSNLPFSQRPYAAQGIPGFTSPLTSPSSTPLTYVDGKVLGIDSASTFNSTETVIGSSDQKLDVTAEMSYQGNGLWADPAGNRTQIIINARQKPNQSATFEPCTNTDIQGPIGGLSGNNSADQIDVLGGWRVGNSQQYALQAVFSVNFVDQASAGGATGSSGATVSADYLAVTSACNASGGSIFNLKITPPYSAATRYEFFTDRGTGKSNIKGFSTVNTLSDPSKPAGYGWDSEAFNPGLAVSWQVMGISNSGNQVFKSSIATSTAKSCPKPAAASTPTTPAPTASTARGGSSSTPTSATDAIRECFIYSRYDVTPADCSTPGARSPGPIYSSGTSTTASPTRESSSAAPFPNVTFVSQRNICDFIVPTETGDAQAAKMISECQANFDAGFRPSASSAPSTPTVSGSPTSATVATTQKPTAFTVDATTTCSQDKSTVQVDFKWGQSSPIKDYVLTDVTNPSWSTPLLQSKDQSFGFAVASSKSNTRYFRLSALGANNANQYSGLYTLASRGTGTVAPGDKITSDAFGVVMPDCSTATAPVPTAAVASTAATTEPAPAAFTVNASATCVDKKPVVMLTWKPSAGAAILATFQIAPTTVVYSFDMPIDATSQTFEMLAPTGFEEAYSVIALNNDGITTVGVAETDATATTVKLTTPDCNPTPSPFTGTVAVSCEKGLIATKAIWDSAKDADHYNIYDTSVPNTRTLLASVPASKPFLDLSALAPGRVDIQFSVEAINGSGRSVTDVPVKTADPIVLPDCTLPPPPAVTVTTPVATDATTVIPVSAKTPIPVIITPTITDLDDNLKGTGATMTITEQPKLGTAVIAPDNKITFTPRQDATGVDTLVYKVCDTTGLCDTAKQTIDIGVAPTQTAAPVNDSAQNNQTQAAPSSATGVISLSIQAVCAGKLPQNILTWNSLRNVTYTIQRDNDQPLVRDDTNYIDSNIAAGSTHSYVVTSGNEKSNVVGATAKDCTAATASTHTPTADTSSSSVPNTSSSQTTQQSPVATPALPNTPVTSPTTPSNQNSNNGVPTTAANPSIQTPAPTPIPTTQQPTTILEKIALGVGSFFGGIWNFLTGK